MVVGERSATPAVLRTDDGAVTWETRTLDAHLSDEVYPLAVDFADAQHGWIAALDIIGGQSPPPATSDGGAGWEVVAKAGAFDGEPVVTLEFVSPLEGWASGESVFHTTDGGVSWTRQAGGFVNGLLALAAADATHVWAGGSGLISTVDAAGDTGGPVTLSDVAGGWSRRAVTMHLTAADVGTAGLASTEYRVDGEAWTPGLTPPGFPAPADHSGDGRHTVDYRSTDTAGNVEPIQSVDVNIDTVRPVVRLGRCRVGRDAVLRMRVRIDDSSCPSVIEYGFTIKDKKGHTVAVSSYWGKARRTNRWFTFREPDWKWLRAGRYTIAVTCKDRAGNRPVRKGTGILVVMKRGGGRNAAPVTQAEPVRLWHRASETTPLAGELDTVRALLRRLERGI
jgi:hypothetical protein